MVTDAKIEIFSKRVNCDRYHLLKPLGNIDDSQINIIHTEEGKAFNGFNQGFIIDAVYDKVKYSKIARITLKGMNLQLNEQSIMEEFPIYCLISNVYPIRNDKTMIELEPDAWLNYRNEYEIGEQNTLFLCSEYLIDYPASDISTMFYKFEKVGNIFECQYLNFIIFYHNSENNHDLVYMFKTLKSWDFFLAYSQELLNIFTDAGIDTNSILAMYLSPFDLDYSNGAYNSWVDLGIQITGISGYYLDYNAFVVENKLKTLTQNHTFVSNPHTKTVILDACGSTIWTANRENDGTQSVNITLELNYNGCNWVGYVDTDTVENRFTIQCLDLGWMLDYFQQYSNIEKSYNRAIRQAHLDKELIDNIGDTVASTLWHGTSSGAPKPDANGIAKYIPATSMIATAGAAAGGTIQTALNYYSTMDYNNKVDRAEYKKATVQYDSLGGSTSNFLRFLMSLTLPAIYYMKPDNQSDYVGFDSNRSSYNRLSYNCYMYSDDVEDVLSDNDVKYISGDFDFIKIPSSDAFQLNTRFKHGITFVNWTDNEGN